MLFLLSTLIAFFFLWTLLCVLNFHNIFELKMISQHFEMVCNSLLVWMHNSWKLRLFFKPWQKVCFLDNLPSKCCVPKMFNFLTIENFFQLCKFTFKVFPKMFNWPLSWFMKLALELVYRIGSWVGLRNWPLSWFMKLTLSSFLGDKLFLATNFLYWE